MFKLLKYLKPYFWLIILIIILTFGQVMANLELPSYMAKIVDEGIIGGDSHLIFSIGLLMLFISLLGMIATVGAGFLAARISTGFSMKMRERVFSKVESFSLVEFNKFSTASLITRSTNDIQQLQTVIFMMLRMMIMAPITGVGAIYKAYHTAPSMTWIMGLAVLVLLSIILCLFFIAVPRFKKVQELIDKLNLLVRENLTGLRVIRAFNSEKHEESKFDQANEDLTKINIFLNRMMGIMQPAMMFIFNITSLLVIWVGAQLISTGSLQVGSMIAFMQYSMQVLFAFMMMSMLFIMIPRASVSGVRIAEILNTELTIKEPENAQAFPDKVCGLVEFKNVTFAYPGAEYPVLEGISFKARPGQITAIVGSTGCGKSTLVNLIPRFYDVSYGHVRVDEVDVKKIKIKDLNDKIGYVPQKGVLFSGSIESNIKYGVPKATEKEVKAAVKIAQATEFIEKNSEKYKAAISQGGVNVSGGQKQRLSIARALIKKPEIYIFDDSFSALDFKTDAALRQALVKETEKSTVLIVAQRVSTVINADQIIVLNFGKIVGIGKHQDLMKSCDVYQEIALSQLSPEELESIK